ncbi:MAG: HAD family hydrolase [Acidimicrobiales bacterium]
MRFRRLLFVVFIALVASACQVDAVVDVDVRDDGSGSVTLTAAFDEEIVAAAPELRDGLRTDDLREAGWTIEGPREAESGGAVVITASKEFVSPEHLPGVLDELAGPSGLFRDFRVDRARSFARTTYTVTGRIDPSVSLETFGDDAIAGLLDEPLGMSLAELEAAAGRPLSETVSLTFSVSLPDTAEADGASVEGNTATWMVQPTDPLVTDIEVTSSVEDQLPRIWAAVALVALALLATLLVFRVLARLGGRRSQRSDPGDEVQLRRPEKASDTGAATAPRERPPRLELVVLDARGVLYDEANDIGARLVPFVRERGSRASLQEINDATRAASLGRLSTAELWGTLGLDGDPAELDALYTEEFRLREGVLEFIDRLHERGLRVAVINNNVLGWSKSLRRRFDLDERVDTWIVSGEIGTRKPESAFFEAVRRMTGVEFADSLLIDDQIDDLDMARSLGMSTAMFVPAGAQLPASSPHPIVHGFDSFFGRKRV